MHLHQAFDSFQSVSRTVNNGAASAIGMKIFLGSIRKLCRSLPQPWEMGTIIRKGQLTCKHYWWSVADTSLVLALAFSPGSSSCQERLLVSRSPCQQGGYIRAPRCGHIIATEGERERAGLSSWCSSTWWEHKDFAVLPLINTAGLFVSNLQ